MTNRQYNKSALRVFIATMFIKSNLFTKKDSHPCRFPIPRGRRINTRIVFRNKAEGASGFSCRKTISAWWEQISNRTRFVFRFELSPLTFKVNKRTIKPTYKLTQSVTDLQEKDNALPYLVFSVLVPSWGKTKQKNKPNKTTYKKHTTYIIIDTIWNMSEKSYPPNTMRSPPPRAQRPAVWRAWSVEGIKGMGGMQGRKNASLKTC